MSHAQHCPRAARTWMSHRRSLALLGAMAVALLLSATLSARAGAAGAFIDNGTIQLGVGDRGHLNEGGAPPSSTGRKWLGLRYLPTNAEGMAFSTSDGDPINNYEGWGAADATSGLTGYTSPVHPGYTKGVQLVSFTHTASSAESVVEVTGAYQPAGSPPLLRVTHDFHPSPVTQNLYEATVTIENVSNQTVQPRYRRVMHWNPEPTTFATYSTIDGSPFPELLETNNCGYALPDPLQPTPQCGNVPFATGFFSDTGPSDLGAMFDFGFDTLAPGGEVTFLIYYGAAASEQAAIQAVNAVDAQTWSFGQPNTQDGATLGTPNTFIFAFSTTTGPPVANDMRLRQVTPASIQGPDELDVRGELKNIGTQDATDVELDIHLPAGLSLVSGSTHHAFSSSVIPGQEVDHTWRVSAPAACDDETYRITIDAAFKNANGSTSFTRSRDRDLLVRGTCAQVTGRVTDLNGGAAIAGAYVYFSSCPQACPPPMSVNALGGYSFSSLVAGTYTLIATGPGAYNPQSRQLTLTAGEDATEDFRLSNLNGPPPGTGVTPTNGTNPDGVPTLPGGVPATVTTQGCSGANATFTVKRGSQVLASGPMTEGPAGTYASAPFGPFGGIVTIETVVACPGAVDTITTVFNAVYIDPSGEVRTTGGEAIQGATVTLLRSDAKTGPFTTVPDGDAIMSPANRKNSDLTDAVGHFGWDVIPGFYKVRASKSGCTAPDGADAVESRIMEIPPPVTDLDLRLRCPKPAGPGGGSGGGSPQPGSGGPPKGPGTVSPPRPKAVAAGVRISRRGASIAVRLTCPKRASSACKVGVALTRPGEAREVAGRHDRSRRATVAGGKTAKLTLSRRRSSSRASVCGCR